MRSVPLASLSCHNKLNLPLYFSRYIFLPVLNEVYLRFGSQRYQPGYLLVLPSCYPPHHFTSFFPPARSPSGAAASSPSRREAYRNKRPAERVTTSRRDSREQKSRAAKFPAAGQKGANFPCFLFRSYLGEQRPRGPLRPIRPSVSASSLPLFPLTHFLPLLLGRSLHPEHPYRHLRTAAHRDVIVVTQRFGAPLCRGVKPTRTFTPEYDDTRDRDTGPRRVRLQPPTSSGRIERATTDGDSSAPRRNKSEESNAPKEGKARLAESLALGLSFFASPLMYLSLHPPRTLYASLPSLCFCLTTTPPTETFVATLVFHRFLFFFFRLIFLARYNCYLDGVFSHARLVAFCYLISW